jgi:hypothetical protein
MYMMRIRIVRRSITMIRKNTNYSDFERVVRGDGDRRR